MSEKVLRDLMLQLKSTKQTLESGQILFKQGDCVKRLYCVEQGVLRLVRNTADGAQPILYEASAGETIAEASLFSEKYQCAAVAVTNSELICCNKQTMLVALKSSPDAMLDLLNAFSGQVRDLRTINEIKNIKRAKERMLSYFKTIANEIGEINLGSSMKDAAHKIGIAHETFYRELSCLEKEAVIVRRGRKITIKNLPV